MKIKVYWFLILFFLSTILLYSQSDIDSLISDLKAKEGVERYPLLIKIIESTQYDAPDLSLQYCEEALQLVRKNGQESVKIYNFMAQAQENLGLIEQAIVNYEHVIEIADDSQKIELAYAAFSLGLIYDDIHYHNKSIRNYELARDLYAELGEFEKQANVHNSIGIIFEELSVFDTALENYFLANNLYQKLGDKEGIGHTFNNIGNIYQNVNNFTKAQQYYEEAIENYKEIELEDGLSSVYNNLGIIFDEKGDFKTALEYYEHSLVLAEKTGDLEGVATSLNNLGVVNTSLGNYELAEEFYRRSLEKATEINDNWTIANSYLNLADLCIDKGNKGECLNYISMGEKLANKYEIRDLQLEVQRIYSRYYSNTENYHKAFDHFMKFSELKDSLYQDMNVRVSEIQTVFETQQQTKEIQLLQLEKKHHKTLTFYAVIFSIFFLIIALWLYSMYRIKKREVITRKELEKNIRSIASVVDQAEESIIITDLEGNIVYVNPCFERVTGYKQDEILGKNPRILKSGFMPDVDYVKLWDNLKKGEGWRGIFLNKKKDGTIYYDSSIIFPVKDENDKIINFAAVKHDITLMKETENELRASEERFRHMADNISEGLTIIEKDRVVYLNNKIEEITGYNKEELKAIPGFGLAAPFEKERVKTFMNMIMGDGFSVNDFEFWIKRKDGNLRFIHNGYSTYKEKGSIVNRYIVTSDLTEHKKVEEKILNSLEEKKILLQEINHRVKNNMQVISSLLKLQTDYIDDDYLLNIFKSCQNRVKSMSLVHEKLYQSDDLAKIEAYPYISKLISNLFTSYSVNREKIKLVLNTKGIYLAVNQAIPCGLIINELVTNSIKYAYDEHSEGTISIDFKKDKDKYSIIIKDDGKGLPEGFDRKKSQSMGLSLVESLIKQLHGTISFTSKKGTEILIEFT